MSGVVLTLQVKHFNFMFNEITYEHCNVIYYYVFSNHMEAAFHPWAACSNKSQRDLFIPRSQATNFGSWTLRAPVLCCPRAGDTHIRQERRCRVSGRGAAEWVKAEGPINPDDASVRSRIEQTRSGCATMLFSFHLLSLHPLFSRSCGSLSTSWACFRCDVGASQD